MTSHFHGVVLASAAACVLCLGASAARADESDLRTIVTLHQSMMVPGATLAPGTYTFILGNPSTTRDVVYILREDGTPVASAGIRRVPRTSDDRHLAVEVALNENGTTPTLKGWFYPGQRDGYMFVYPYAEARMLARAETVDIDVAPRG